MLRSNLATIYIFSALLVAQYVPAQTLKVTSPLLGESIQMPGKPGLYSDIFSYLVPLSDGQVEFNILPIKRAFKAFVDNKYECIWGTDSGVFERLGLTQEALISSDIVFWSAQYIFSARDSEVFSSLPDLKGKKVVVNTGAAFLSQLQDHGVEVSTVNNEELKVKMLKAGRVDAFIAWMPDIAVYFKKYGVNPEFDSDASLARDPIRIVCHESENTMRFIESADQMIEKLKQSGDLERIFERYGVTDHLF